MKPILFNTEMVRAILDGRKTQTRRVIKVPPTARLTGIGGGQADFEWRQKMKNADIVLDKYKDVGFPYQPGDILYVRETWNYCGLKKADWTPDQPVIAWRPSIHMPKTEARLFLRVTDVRVERLREIMDAPPGPENPVVKEGCNYGCDFIAEWQNAIKPADRDRYGWDANPWVWVICFERCEKPEEGDA